MNWSLKKFDNYCIVDMPKNVFNDEIIQSLKNLLIDLSENDYNVFFLNMGQIPKVCSKSLAYIINIYKFANAYDLDIKLYNLHPYSSQLIYQTRLNQVFDICDPNTDFNTDFHQEECLSQACRSSCR